jgi:hypothetical protein
MGIPRTVRKQAPVRHQIHSLWYVSPAVDALAATGGATRSLDGTPNGGNYTG